MQLLEYKTNILSHQFQSLLHHVCVFEVTSKFFLFPLSVVDSKLISHKFEESNKKTTKTHTAHTS